MIATTSQRITLTRRGLVTGLMSAVMIAGNNADAGNFFSGEKIYKQYCQSCHGVKGQGGVSGAPNFARGQGLMKPDASLYHVIDSGRNAMPAFRGVLKEEDFYDVITYIRSFY